MHAQIKKDVESWKGGLLCGFLGFFVALEAKGMPWKQ